MFRSDVLVVIMVVSCMEISHSVLFCVDNNHLKWALKKDVVSYHFTEAGTGDTLWNVGIDGILVLCRFL